MSVSEPLKSNFIEKTHPFHRLDISHLDHMCTPSAPTPKSSGDLIWTLSCHLRHPPHGKEQRSCHLDAMWPPAAPMQGRCRCECILCLQNCSPFRKSAEPSYQSFGKLCSATALLHVQPLRRMLNIRHVRSKSGEGCLLGFGFVRWGSMTLDGHREGLSRLRHSMGGSLCSCVPPKMLLAGCGVVWEGRTTCLPYSP